MKSEFHAVMLRRNELLHRLAIWQEVAEHLSKFLDTDAVPASIGIRTEGGGMVVPQDRIVAVLDEIKHISVFEITEELGRIDKSKVEEDAKKGKSDKKKVKGKSAKVTGKGAKAKKRTKASRPRSK